MQVYDYLLQYSLRRLFSIFQLTPVKIGRVSEVDTAKTVWRIIAFSKSAAILNVLFSSICGNVDIHLHQGHLS